MSAQPKAKVCQNETVLGTPLKPPPISHASSGEPGSGLKQKGGIHKPFFYVVSLTYFRRQSVWETRLWGDVSERKSSHADTGVGLQSIPPGASIPRGIHLMGVLWKTGTSHTGM